MAKIEISSETGTVPWSVKVDGKEMNQDLRNLSVDFGQRGDMLTVTLEIYADASLGEGGFALKSEAEIVTTHVCTLCDGAHFPKTRLQTL